MKIFNLWKLNLKQTGLTGPWEFVAKVRVVSEKEAIAFAQMRFGVAEKYKAYEGFENL